MSDSLLVPITLEILLANQALRARDAFRVWRHTYDALREFCSPEPLAFDSDTIDTRTGAFLHWTLPRSLRTSKKGTSTEFPLVPNRWLINRVSRHATTGTSLKSWVLESDHLKNDAAKSSYFLVTGDTLNDWNRKAAGAQRAQVLPRGLATGALWNASTASGDAYPVNIGQAFALAAWQEPAKANQTDLFLTAVAPGNLEFSAYVPFNEGVFSFFDDLLSVNILTDEQTKLPNNTELSYQVTGWYSDPEKDVLATGPGSFTTKEHLADALAALSWQLELPADSVPPTAARSLYSGAAFGLRWTDEPSAVPVPDELETARYHQHHNVALANNSVDAFSTLVGAQLEVEGYPDATHVVELLRAFHYDMLPLLDQPNGSELLSERIRQEWFSSRAGGTRWTIVAKQPVGRPAASAAGQPAAPAAPAPGVDLTLTPDEATKLRELNGVQQSLDQAVAELTGLQWALHASWWKKGYFTAAGQPADTPPAATAAVVDKLTKEQQHLLSQVVKKLSDIKALQGEIKELQAQIPSVVPDPVDGTAFVNAAAAPTARIPSADKTLKAIAQPRYWLPGNPTVVISQVTPAEITDPDSRLTVRPAKQPERSLLPDGTPYPVARLGPDIIPPLLNPGSLPADVAGLYQEFCLIDPTNAERIAAKVRADVPAQTPQAGSPAPLPIAAYINANSVLRDTSRALWQQLWQPLYLEWEVMYTDVPLADPVTGQANWRFTGTDYDLKPGVGSAKPPQALSGRSLLSPSAQRTFGDRLKKFVGNAKADLQPELSRLNAEIEAVDQWAFLSQELVGFNDLLTQRDTRIFRRPSGETGPDEAGHSLLLEQLMGYPGEYSNDLYDTPAYAQGLINSVPAIAPRGHSAFPFHAIRSGQLYLSHLLLYDKFGRKLELIAPNSAGLLDANIFPLIRDANVVPTATLMPTITAPVQLPPRLLQPARLDLLLVDQQDNRKVLGQVADVNPVGGWLLVNHLDQALLLFAPDGSSMGELKLGPRTAHPPVRWTPPPHTSGRAGIDADKYPQLAAFAKFLALPPAERPPVQYPQLAEFAAAIVAGATPKSALEFRALLQVIDSTLWTVDPLGSRADQHLSVLVGRPLALVSLQLQFSLYGPAMTSADWSASDAPAAPVPVFSVRLGNHASREDGVIGYFEGGDYTTFNSVVAPDDVTQSYVQEIGPLGPGEADGNYLSLAFDQRPAATITLLVDPRATIHATTGILPVKSLELPRQFVDKALANMDISFRVGPLLSRIKPAPTPVTAPTSPAPVTAPIPAAGVAAVTAPAPALGSPLHLIEKPRPTEDLSYLPLSEKKGTWSWWEKMADLPSTPAASSWKEYGLAAATAPAVAATSVATTPAATSAAASAGAAAATNSTAPAVATTTPAATTPAATVREPATLREGYLQFRASPEPANS